MKTKFIGIDGFGEIENVKTTRKRKNSFSTNVKKFIKISRVLISETAEEYKASKAERKAAKPTRLEQHYANQRKQGAQALSTKAIAVSKRVAKQNELRHTVSRKPFSPHFLKRKAALGFATSIVAVVMCTVASTNAISFNAFASEDNEAQSSAAVSSVKDNEITNIVNAEFAQSREDSAMLTEGYGLYIDDELVGVSLDENSLKKELEKALDNYKAKYDDETTDEFANDVKIVYGAYKSSYIGDSESIVQDNLDKFSFSLSTDIVYTQTVPFTTTVKYDSSHYTDYRKTTQKGVNGKQKIIYRVTYVDGVQTDAVVTKTKVLKKAKEQIVVVGTKSKSSSTSTSTQTSYYQSSYSSGSGSFMWPLPYTRNITSGYGARWGRMHSGIDISAGGVYGKAVVASDGGTVEWAGYDSSGYGNYVIINHNNGYKTLYGHCSAVYVSRGQSVSKGATIAAVGSTGDSTGPHLHFEIRTSGGSRLNPLGFV